MTWAAGGGGGSSLFPPTGTGTATGNVIGDLDGNTLEVQQGGNSFLSIDPTTNAESVLLQAYNTTDDDNKVLFQGQTDNTGGAFEISSEFNSNEKAQIVGTAVSGSATLDYTADTHTFTGAIIAGSLLNDSGQDRLVGQTASDGQLGYITVGSGLDLTAGVLTATVTASSTTTFSNKRWVARVGSTTSSATPTINTDNVDIYKLTAQSGDITSFTTNLTGTPNDGDVFEVQITGTATRNITWGASFSSSTVTLPTATDGTNTLTVIFQYFTTSSYGNNTWVCVNYF
ncbi:MAG TPA: hypothetical protein PKV73_01040 [Agriterribacter sp.]|nr:hypothetical protein [Agriterribacter sp.]